MSSPVIITKRHWSFNSVRETCIKHHLYTRGTCGEYERMLKLIETMIPTYENIYIIARNIKEHSEECDIAYVMFLLENKSVVTTFEIYGNDEI